MAGYMKYVIVAVIALVVNFIFIFPAELHFKTPDFARTAGYPVETHPVDTSDGYTLYVHRIPKGKDPNATFTKRPPVLLMTGLGCSSDSWFLAGPKNNLVYLLADKGYDVWLGNTRGSAYSISNKKPASGHDSYSFHHFGLYDLSAIIDHILNVTGNEQLSYIGFSMGSTELFVLASIRPEYNSKIGIFIGLAPALIPINLSTEVTNLYTSLKNTQTVPMFPYYATNPSWFRSLLTYICCHIHPNCVQVLDILGGFKRNTNQTRNAIILSHLGADNLLGPIQHYMSNGETGAFRWPDHGEEKNLEVYNSKIPPLYDLKNVRMPVILFYAESDSLVGSEGIELLQKELPNVFLTEKVNVSPAGHNDLLWGEVDHSDLLLFLPIPF